MLATRTGGSPSASASCSRPSAPFNRRRRRGRHHHPGGIEFIAAHLWRGIVYGAADGLLLSAFPILLVFAALRDSRLRRRAGGLIAVGAVAMVASLAMTAVYHAGYRDFRAPSCASR